LTQPGCVRELVRSEGLESATSCWFEPRPKVGLVRFGTAILLVPLQRVPPPKESVKEFLENRRLLKSIAVLPGFAIALE
jgi:hypothetical protein